MPDDLPLEDEATDILAKACRGRGLDAHRLATAAGVAEDAVESILAGDLTDQAALEAVGRVLALDPSRLIAIADRRWHPGIDAPNGLIRVTTPWDDFAVNCYLCHAPESAEAVLFDTGADAAAVLEEVEARGLRVGTLLITHTHPDHIAALSDLRRTWPDVDVRAPAGEPVEGTEPIHEGDTWMIGGLRITALSTPGHSPDGTSFRVDGLAVPVVIAGDAIFAGSIGGPNISLAAALENIREKIFTLPPETVICPGHGPLTTVESERVHNPFFS